MHFTMAQQQARVDFPGWADTTQCEFSDHGVTYTAFYGRRHGDRKNDGIEPVHPVKQGADGHEHHPGEHCFDCEYLFKQNQDFTWNGRLPGRSFIKSAAIAIARADSLMLAHTITAEDCALLWALGIRADEDMADATLRI